MTPEDYRKNYEKAGSDHLDLIENLRTLQDRVYTADDLKEKALLQWVQSLQGQGQQAAQTLPWRSIGYDENQDSSWGPTSVGHISSVCEEMCLLVKVLGEPVEFSFNETPARCEIDSTPESVFLNWHERRVACQERKPPF